MEERVGLPPQSASTKHDAVNRGTNQQNQQRYAEFSLRFGRPSPSVVFSVAVQLSDTPRPDLGTALFETSDSLSNREG
jgi:hypothetical protein